MAILKCKMCGGDLSFDSGATVCECEYCGSKQTIPTADNEKKVTLFARANRLLRSCEFDKAEGIFESIVAEFPEEAEAYWGLVLCKYGIEYVDDPASGKKVPTCHRSSFDSVMDDSDFEQVMENADTVARAIYREQAKQIEELRKGIIEVSGKEEPYDIFICYKETDEHNDRTIDSVLAQDIYDALTSKEYRVFFSRISLEDKLGVEYEPYIFAALNSAKVMLAIGTSYDYYNAVWVKNEWGRYLKLMAADKSKYLIPCYKDIDAYDIPKEFAKLQAQDLGKVGAIQDLLRGIEKLIPPEKTVEHSQSSQTVVVQQSGGPNVESLLKRGKQALEDEDWQKANEFFDRVLDMDAENAEAFFGKYCADIKYKKEEELAEDVKAVEKAKDNTNYQRAVKYGSNEQKKYWEELFISAEQKREAEKQKLEEAPKRLSIIRQALRIANIMISADATHSIGLKADGTVISTAYKGDYYHNQCEVGDWKDIISIRATNNRSFGIKADGRVVRTVDKCFGDEDYKDVDNWKDIISIGQGMCLPALKADGSVITSVNKHSKYGQCNVSSWKNIREVQSNNLNTFGLNQNGTVIATECKFTDTIPKYTAGKIEDNEINGMRLQVAVEKWKNIVSISVGLNRIAGLKEDGTVVIAQGLKDTDMGIVEKWNDIIELSIGKYHIIGLKKNGTVVGAGLYQCEVEGWRDIVAICAGPDHTLGIKADGTVVSTKPFDEYENYGQCDVNGWTLFNMEDLIKKCRIKAESLASEEGRFTTAINELKLKLEKEESKKQTLIELKNKEQELFEKQVYELQRDLESLKGFFNGIKRKEIKLAIENIRAQHEEAFYNKNNDLLEIENNIKSFKQLITQYNQKIMKSLKNVNDIETLIKELEKLNQ
ncbi:TIR domain-containing protein [Oribacterium sp. FC2011]|uniref:TIR domain-containing protein n=1 Tax=Oribacterium sp. FC2011 TaxID=1408311 RepID=UPI0018CC512B|nr:TIR domain-containing protein [Oribacterium sp. FC2011]